MGQLGGFNAGAWDETLPPDSEAVGTGAARIRSVKTTIDQTLDSEHIWPSSGGTIGQHRAGSARAFYGLQSQVSASDTSTVADGRMMITSDTTRLFSVNSGGRALLGAGPGSLSVDTTSGMSFGPQNVRWAFEGGIVASPSSQFKVTFPNSGFSGIPFLQVSMYTQTPGNIDSLNCFVWKLHVLTASGFSGELVDSTNNVFRSDCGIQWMSIGTRAL